MKKTNYKKVKKIFIPLLLVVLTTPMFSQKNDSNDVRNQISFGYGLNIPSGDYVTKDYAQGGSNFSISYTRNIWKTLVISAKYVNLSNSEEITKDLIDLTVSSPSSYGSWTGTSSKFNASALLVGVGQNFETGKKKKLISGYKFLIGSNSLSTPDYNFESSTGIAINQPSSSSNAFIYDLSFSIGYKISKSLILFIESDIYKSNIKGSATATVTYLSNTSSQKEDYNISYNNTSLTCGLGYIF
jgi:hypothetical protein